MHYRSDLAYIHHHGFSEFAESAAPGIIAMLRADLSSRAESRDLGLGAGRAARSSFPTRPGPSTPLGMTGGDQDPRTGGSRHPLVIEVGCGSGILARELTTAGFEVLGSDASPAMLRLARRTAPEARFRRATFASMRIPPCDAVLAVGEVLNYGTFAHVRVFVGNTARALRKGGVLLFDVAERNAYPASEEHRSGGDDWSVIAIKTSDGRSLTRRVLTFRRVGRSIHRDEEVHHLELYDRAELLALLREHGFRVRVRRSYGTRRLPPGHSVYLAVRR